MKKIVKRIIDAATWAASTDLAGINLPREGIITDILIRFNGTATLTAAAYDDWFRRVIQNIKVQGDGGKNYLGMGGTQMSTLLSLWQEIKDGIPTVHSNGAGIALAAPDVGSTAFTSVFRWHPGNNPRDRFDLSAGIPAMDLSTLQILLTTTAAAVTDAAGAITAGTFNFEISEVLLTPEEKARMGMIMAPDGSTQSYAHTANFTDFGKDFDVPTGAFLRSLLMCVRDDTATVPRRKDDEVTAVKIWLPKTGEIILEENIYELKQGMMARFGCHGVAGDVGPIGAIATIRPAPESLQDMVPAGFVIVDFRELAHPDYGLDLRSAQTGDVKMGLTIANYAAGDSTTFYYDRLIPTPLRP